MTPNGARPKRLCRKTDVGGPDNTHPDAGRRAHNPKVVEQRSQAVLEVFSSIELIQSAVADPPAHLPGLPPAPGPANSLRLVVTPPPVG